MTPDSLFGVAAVAAKYFFADIKKLIDVYLESTREYPEYIIPATKYQNEEALAFATRTLFDQILNINVSTVNVKKIYFEKSRGLIVLYLDSSL